MKIHARQLVQSTLGKGVAVTRTINHRHRNRLAQIGDVPTSACCTVSHNHEGDFSKVGRTTVGGVPGDRRRRCDIRERRQIFKGVVALGQQTVRSVGARNRGERLFTLVVSRVPGDPCGGNGQWRGKESDDRNELHDCE